VGERQDADADRNEDPHQSIGDLVI